MKDVTPMLWSISRILYKNFRREFSDLAMDVEDVFQESYLAYLDFEKRFKYKFKEGTIWSATKQYVVWKTMQKIYNWKKRDVQLLSLDTEVVDLNNKNRENIIHEKILKSRGMIINRKSPLKDEKELRKILIRNHSSFSLKSLETDIGKKRFGVFIDVLMKDKTLQKIAKKHKISRAYVKKIYYNTLNKLKLRFN